MAMETDSRRLDTTFGKLSLADSSDGYSGSSASYGAVSESYSAVNSTQSSGCYMDTSVDRGNQTTVCLDRLSDCSSSVSSSVGLLPEPERAPWADQEVLNALRKGRARHYSSHVTVEMMRQLACLLQRPLVRITREARRLSEPLRICTAHELHTALKLVLSDGLLQRCACAGFDVISVHNSSLGGAERGRAVRCRLRFSVGKFHRWLVDAQVALYVRETAAIFLTAAMETLLEEIVLISLAKEKLGDKVLTVSALENGIASSTLLWGMLQPYDHLVCAIDATGALLASPIIESVTPDVIIAQETQGSFQRSLYQCLLTTRVKSFSQLGDLVSRAMHYWYDKHTPGNSADIVKLTWTREALMALFYYFKGSPSCDRDESIRPNHAGLHINVERLNDSMPPLVEWIRAVTAHTLHRSGLVIDADDVQQTARVFLPGVDCPPRQLQAEEEVCLSRHLEAGGCIEKFRRDMSFHMLSCGRIDVLPQAVKLLGREGVNTINEQGMTALMYACLRGDEAMVQLLLDYGANMNIAVSVDRHIHPSAHRSTATWTALTFAASQGHISIVQLLLERGANVDGALTLGNEKHCETPLQMAAAMGNNDLVSLLLTRGAGCTPSSEHEHSALVLAAAHGHRRITRKLTSLPVYQPPEADMLTEEKNIIDGNIEFKCEEDANENIYMTIDEIRQEDNHQRHLAINKSTKASAWERQSHADALFYASGHGYLEIALDLRNLGVPWTCYTWSRCLEAAYNMTKRSILHRLLSDFFDCHLNEQCHLCPEFFSEYLPLLFDIFRHSKKEKTTLSRLIRIFTNLYGNEQTLHLDDTTTHCAITRIDPRYVNSPELSDIQFMIQGRVFYAHKIVLANASSRFRTMLGGVLVEGASCSTIEINDIRYHIFQYVMRYLYNGTEHGLHVTSADTDELLDAAHFFQLTGLQRYCEVIYSKMINISNCVDIYKRAKRFNCADLIVYCEGYFLRNLANLHRDNDVFRRLLFSSKLHGYELVNGLLATITRTIRQRTNCPPGEIVSKC